jgi:hypothetical protein
VIFDKANITMLARMPTLFATWWDVTLKGATPARVKEWSQEHGTQIPDPGTMFAHNENVTYEVKTPGGSAKGIDWNEFYRDLILTSSGVSPQIFAGASYRFAETASPMYRITKRLRAKFVCFLEQALCVASGLDKDQVVVKITPSTSPDLLRLANAMVRVGDALTGAMASGWIEAEQAKTLFLSLTKFLGDSEPTEEPQEA